MAAGRFCKLMGAGAAGEVRATDIFTSTQGVVSRGAHKIIQGGSGECKEQRGREGNDKARGGYSRVEMVMTRLVRESQEIPG